MFLSTPYQVPGLQRVPSPLPLIPPKGPYHFAQLEVLPPQGLHAISHGTVSKPYGCNLCEAFPDRTPESKESLPEFRVPLQQQASTSGCSVLWDPRLMGAPIFLLPSSGTLNPKPLTLG